MYTLTSTDSHNNWLKVSLSGQSESLTKFNWPQLSMVYIPVGHRCDDLTEIKIQNLSGTKQTILYILCSQFYYIFSDCRWSRR